MILDQFSACWEELDDPRTGNAALHDFNELLMIALCAVLCGGQGAVDMALFAEAKEPFLRSFLKLANGLPSHDTFSRLFRRLDREQFQAAFQRFMSKFSQQLQGVIAIDGKVLRRSFDKATQDFRKVATGFRAKILLKQRTLSRVSLAKPRKPA